MLAVDAFIRNGSEYRRVVIDILIVIIAFILRVIIGIILDGIAEYETAITVISGMISAIAAILLAVLYCRQTSIQEEQTELMKASYKPIIVRRSSTIADNEPPQIIRYKLRNIGDGPATNLRQYVSLDFPHNILEYISKEQDLWRPDENRDSLFEGSNYLTAGSKVETFKAYYAGQYVIVPDEKLEDLNSREKGEFGALVGDSTIYSLDNTLSMLYEEGVEEVEIEISILYENVLDRTRKLEIIPQDTIQLEDYCDSSHRSLSGDINKYN